MKTLSKAKNLFSIFLFLILFSSCEKEDNVSVNTQDNIFSELEANFNQLAFSKTVPFEFEADWYNAQKHYSDELKAEYFEISIKDLGITPKRINENKPIYQIDYKIIAIENDDDSYSYYAVKFYQKLNNENNLTPASSISFANTESFTGLINVIDNEREMVFAKRLTDGTLNDDKLFAQKEFKKPSFLKRFDEDCTTETIELWEDWYNVAADGTMYYHHSTFIGYETNVTCGGAWLPDLDISGGGGGGSYVNRSGAAGVYRACGGPHCQYEIEEVVVFDQIDSDDLKGKEKCLHNLLDKNGDSFVKDIFKNFKGDSEFDIKIKSKDKVISSNTNKEVNGNCSPPQNGIITINISTSKSNSNSALEVARTLLHEYIHADIFRKLKTKDPTSEDLEFRETYEKYKEQFSGQLQHETMAELYVRSMRDALKDFHKNVLTTDYNKFVDYYEEAPSNLFYEALAWRGLRNHDVKAYTDLSDDKKAELADEDLKIDLMTKGCPNSN